MDQLYTKESLPKQLRPTRQTIQFLIDYSKSLKIVKVKTNQLIELNLN